MSKRRMDCSCRPDYDRESSIPFSDLHNDHASKDPGFFCLDDSSDAADAGGLSQPGVRVWMFFSCWLLRGSGGLLLCVGSGVNAD